VKIAMNVGNPQLAFDFAQLPNDGVGLARLEFIISNTIGIHSEGALEYDRLEPKLKAEVAKQRAAMRARSASTSRRLPRAFQPLRPPSGRRR
jgi:phosphoenolpyruvate synthase/pyruvate phosphate dikinase